MSYGEVHRLDVAGLMPESVSVDRDPEQPDHFVIDALGFGSEVTFQIVVDAAQLAVLVSHAKEYL